ncbi:WD repeat-containing protein 46-like [Paramacrobiotus metropolitanus]|uniref:WD repeat-containing protein 46-like n=1 Tax=Paramacrobiotus metropolitanus TaxID=2943436 RepID=UPI002445F8AD|nr:WD repeat-containing protein 46-like [Paramacrobiotus metropolitanus]
MKKKEEKIYFSKQQAARTHLLRTETAGFLEAEGPLEDTARVTQKELSQSVDLQSQSKHFELRLKEFGPYGFQYTRNGRFLMLYGKQGHVATMDWLTKTLACEMHVQERINCGQWLHQETMFALAQKHWLHIYDNKGIELHCIKKLFQVNCMDFLPYHFLLATGSERGFLSWLDISLGQMVAQFPTKLGRLSTLRKNPATAIVHLGHANGTVSLWSPNVSEPLVKFLSHESAVRALDIDSSGRFMATAGCDRKMKIWDLRMYRPLHEISVFQAPVSLAFSQTGLLAVGMERSVEVLKFVGDEDKVETYMKHFVKNGLSHVEFCPFEDVLGCGYSEGFTSLLIPGAGEAHLDALEANPFQTKRQRQEMEVHSLLEKIPAELIALDPSQIAHVHEPSLQEHLEEKSRVLYARMPKVEFTPKFKAIGGSAGWTKRKTTVKEEKKRQQIKEAIQARKRLLDVEQEEESEEEVPRRTESVFDRFKKKNV